LTGSCGDDVCKPHEEVGKSCAVDCESIVVGIEGVDRDVSKLKYIILFVTIIVVIVVSSWLIKNVVQDGFVSKIR
jgi:hypothetical protein